MFQIPLKMSESKFLKIICPRCSSKQVVFGKSALLIKCLKCNKLLLKTTGGKARIKARITKIW